MCQKVNVVFIIAKLILTFVISNHRVETSKDVTKTQIGKTNGMSMLKTKKIISKIYQSRPSVGLFQLSK